MSRRNIFLGTILLVLLTSLAYLPVINGSAGYVWDDDMHVTQNTALHDEQGLVNLWTWGPRALFDHSVRPATQQYYPVTFTSFWLEYQAWQLNPLGYHVTNVCLHLLASILLWAILRQLGLSPGVSFFAAALFAVHPVNTESVAWISERKNTLSLALYLLSALLWIRWARLDTDSEATALPTTTRSLIWLNWSVLLFALALLAKSVTVTLPAALLVVIWWKRGKLPLKHLLGLLPLVVLGTASAILTITIETSASYIGAFGRDFNFTFVDRCLIAGRAIWFYLASLVAPVRLVFFYPRWQINPAAFWQWLFPAGVLALLAVLFLLRKRVGRGPLAAVLFFIVSLAPALGFINFYPMQFSFVADHFLYIAGIGICTLLAAALGYLLRKVPATVTGALAAIPLLACTGLTYRQATEYHDEVTLYRRTLEKNPQAWAAAENLAVLRFKADGQKAYPEVVSLYRQTLAANPADAKAYNALGGTYLAMHQYADAQHVFEKAVALDPSSADFQEGLATALLMQSQYDAAATRYDFASARAPDNPEYLAGGGMAMLESGHPVEAEQRFRQAIALQKGDRAKYAFDLGLAMRDQGRLGLATQALRDAIAIDPKRPEAFYELANIFVHLHEDGMAIEYFQSAIHLKKDYLDAQVALGQLLMLTDEPGRRDPLWAADLFRQAIAESPDEKLGLHMSLAEALAAANFYEEAAEALQDGLAPGHPLTITPEEREVVLTRLQHYQVLAANPPVPAAAPGAMPPMVQNASRTVAAPPAPPPLTPAPNPTEPHFIPPP